MRQWELAKLAREGLGAIAALAFFVGLIVLYNIVSPVATRSRVHDGHWGGYYEIENFGTLPGCRIWCLCKFFEAEGKLSMVMLSPGKTTDVFSVRRESRDASFVHFYFDAKESTVKIEAKQLYLGKRYALQRLLVGRFGDFWKRNDDDSIRGSVEMEFKPNASEFAIERIDEDRVLEFCNELVLGEKGFSSLHELDSFLDEAAALP